MLPQETIAVEGHSYPCYVVHVTSNDSAGSVDKDTYSDTTLWIDKTVLVSRKKVSHSSTYTRDGANAGIRIPYLEDNSTVYPAADFNPRITPDMFTFTPPTNAKEAAKLEPDFYVPQPSGPKVTMVGQPAPNVSFIVPEGRKIELSSYHGHPPWPPTAPGSVGHVVWPVSCLDASSQPYLHGRQEQRRDCCHGRRG